MSSIKLVDIILGTRPEAIKLAPVILKLNECELIETRVILTGQHLNMVNNIMELFDIRPDLNLKVMKDTKTLLNITSDILKGLQQDFEKIKPDLLLIQGDTTSAFAAALSGFYNKVPIGHVEAGLRTNNLMEPFPEEANRRLISEISNLHFAPTSTSYENLLLSNILGKKFITGNTVIDALLLLADNEQELAIPKLNSSKKKVILVTVHRRENWGENIRNIINALKIILEKNKEVLVLIPLHPNKIVNEPFKEMLGQHPQVSLIEPLPYDKLIGVLKRCYFVLTDSGGLQEEAPALAKPVLVLRGTTERPEGVEAGTAKLVGTNVSDIVKESNLLLNNEDAYLKMSQSSNPYGDGTASEKIRDACINFLFD